MNREKRLTKREQKALKGPRPGTASTHQHEHIHCVACGRHIDAAEFAGPTPTAKQLRCRHGTLFPSCTECEAQSRRALETHDRTGQAVQKAMAWH